MRKMLQNATWAPLRLGSSCKTSSKSCLCQASALEERGCFISSATLCQYLHTVVTRYPMDLLGSIKAEPPAEEDQDGSESVIVEPDVEGGGDESVGGQPLPVEAKV